MAFILQKPTWFSAGSYRRPMEREFMGYCGRCGQHLNWAQYEQARIVCPGAQKTGARAKGPDPAVKSVIRLLFSAGR